jgi:hypothetical protein
VRLHGSRSPTHWSLRNSSKSRGFTQTKRVCTHTVCYQARQTKSPRISRSARRRRCSPCFTPTALRSPARYPQAYPLWDPDHRVHPAAPCGSPQLLTPARQVRVGFVSADLRFPAAPHARPPVLDTLNSRTVAFLGACWLRVSRLQGPPRGEGSGVPPPAPPGPPALPRPPPAGSPRAGEARVGRARPFSECPVTCSHFPREVFLMQPKRVNARCTCSR